jgi:molybdenum cofactor cytidylyltransferase
MVSALLLAAGESQRMGQFKQLMPFRGKSFVQCCVDNLLASRAREVIVVTGHRAEEVRNALSGRSVRFAHNPDYRQGMSSSIKCGIRAISDRASAVIIALVDQPHIGTDIFDLLIATYEKDRPLIVVPSYGGRVGHPVLLDMRLKEEILAMDPSIGLRQVIGAHQQDTARVEIGDQSILKDFDSPEDLNC